MITLGTVLTVALAACGGAETEPSPQPEPEPTPAPAPSPEPGDLAISISPDAGTVTTDVTVRAEGFAPGADVGIGFGPPASEYEIFAHARADSRGTVETVVNVPDWAESGRDYLFVAKAPDGSDVLSSQFRVKAEDGETDGSIQVTGQITGEGVECPALRSDDGELYTLAGETGRFGEGDRVTVEGTVAETSFCMQGTTIEVEDISDAG